MSYDMEPRMPDDLKDFTAPRDSRLSFAAMLIGAAIAGYWIVVAILALTK